MRSRFTSTENALIPSHWRALISTPHDWADQTLQYVTGVTGTGPRIVVPEMGDLPPIDQVNWNTQRALESLVFLLHKYGIDGGSFWRWTSFQNGEDSDPTLATPVKQRGANFVFNPVQKEVLDMGGFHLPMVPNGSYEGAVAVNGVPVSWTGKRKRCRRSISADARAGRA